MKLKLFLILFMSLGLCLQSKADTDISAYQNVLYVSPQTAMAGTHNYVISVKLKNSAEISGFQFDVVVPKGITFCVDGDGESLASTTDDRLPAGKFILTTRVKNETTLGLVCWTMAKNNATGHLYAASGNDGEVIKIPVNISSSMAPGNYNIKVVAQDFSDPNAGLPDGTPGTKAVLESTLTVTAPENRTVLDESSTTAPTASDGVVDVRVNRTINANEWSTICLPFDMTAAQLKTAFGNDVKLAKFKDWSSNFVNDDDEYASSITINFSSVTSLSANTPYMIKTSKDIKTFTVDGVTIAPATVEQTYGKTRNGTYGAFHGTYVANTTLDDGMLFLSGDKFWYSVGKTVMKAFRCYLETIVTLDYKNAASSAKVSYFVDNTATNINDLNIVKLNNDRVYSLDGRLMGEAGMINSLPKGVYIKNGKKILVK